MSKGQLLGTYSGGKVRGWAKLCTYLMGNVLLITWRSFANLVCSQLSTEMNPPPNLSLAGSILIVNYAIAVTFVHSIQIEYCL